MLKPTKSTISLKSELLKAIIMAFVATAVLGTGLSVMDFGNLHNFKIEKPAVEQETTEAPSYENHITQSRKVCHGPVANPDDGKPASDVVVVGFDGETRVMDTTVVIKRLTNKTDNDDLWVVGVCKKHLSK